MAGCTRFTSLDLKSAYWQVMVHPDDQAKTAYVVPGHGVHKFVRMPYGLTNAPATFQQLMEKVLQIPKDGNSKNGTGACFAFLDDIIIPSKDVDDGLTRLEHVLESLERHNLKLHPKKCKLLQQELAFLGHRISAEGITQDVKKSNGFVIGRSPGPPPKYAPSSD